MNRHVAGFLGIAGAQLTLVWGDQNTDLVGKIALSVITLLTILFTDPKKHAAAQLVLRSVAVAAALGITLALAKCSLSASVTGVLTTAAAVFVRLQAMIPQSSPPPAVALLVLGAALLVSETARAESRPCPQLAVCFPAYNLRLAPGAGVGWQLNLKTGDAAQGVALVGGSITWDNGSFPSLGVGLFGGTSIDPDGARYQGSVVFDILDWVGLGIGLQGFQVRDHEVQCPDGTIIPGEKRLVWQGVLSVVGKVTIGGTPRAFVAAAKGSGG
jgi:hypothetical protein